MQMKRQLLILEELKFLLAISSKDQNLGCIKNAGETETVSLRGKEFSGWEDWQLLIEAWAQVKGCATLITKSASNSTMGGNSNPSNSSSVCSSGF